MEPASDPRDELVKAAFRYRNALVSYAFGMVRDWSLAQDIVQDAFIVVMNKWENFRPGTSVFSWVRQIVYFKTMEALRARSREIPAVDEELQSLVNETLHSHLDDRAAEHQNRMGKALQECMTQLSARNIRLLAGFYSEAKSCESLASMFNRSVEAVRMLLSRVRKQLRDCMENRLREAAA